MTLAEFHNALRVIRSIDHDEVPFLDEQQWDVFMREPERFFIRADDDTAAKIWAAMKKRGA